MSSPRLKREQSFDFEEPSAQEAMGSASASYSPPGGVFGLSPPESSPRDSRKRSCKAMYKTSKARVVGMRVALEREEAMKWQDYKRYLTVVNHLAATGNPEVCFIVGRSSHWKDRPSWVKHTFTPDFDGHLWRKYGQKNIKDSAFPRLYYRCSYREDKQCLASKLVQQESNDDPPLFKVTYTYEHTCNTAPVPTPDVVAEPPAPAADAFLLRFDSAGGHGDAQQMEQERQYQPTPRRPFFMLSFDSNSQLHEQPAFPSELPPAASFPAETLPAPPPSTTDGGDMFSTWDLFRYGLDDYVHFGDHVFLPDNGNDIDGDGNY